MKKPVNAKCCRSWQSGVPPKWLVFVAAVTVQIGFGLYPVVVKKYAAKEHTNPLIFSFYRDLLCFPVLFICALVAERKILIPSFRILIVLMLLGLVGMFGNQLFYIVGVYFAGPDIASAFQPIIPVWTAILAGLTCIEKIPHPIYVHGWAKFAGIMLAAVGAIEIAVTGKAAGGGTETGSGHSSGHKISTYLLGVISLFLNTVCMSIYILLQKKFIFLSPNCRWKDYPVWTTAYSYLFGALFMGLASLYYPITGNTGVFFIPKQSLYALVFAIFITSALCYLLITWTNMHLSSSIATAFWPVQVFVTVLSAWLVKEDELRPWQFLGAIMLLVGLLFVLFSNHMSERQIHGRPVWRLDSLLGWNTGRRGKKRGRGRERCSSLSNDSDEYKPLIASQNRYKDSEDMTHHMN